MSSGEIRVAPIDAASGELSQLHLLPCKVAHTGPAPVSSYFEVRKDEDSDHAGAGEFLEARFRGRMLKGKVVSLPTNFRGTVY